MYCNSNQNNDLVLHKTENIFILPYRNLISLHKMSSSVRRSTKMQQYKTKLSKKCNLNMAQYLSDQIHYAWKNILYM